MLKIAEERRKSSRLWRPMSFRAGQALSQKMPMPTVEFHGIQWSSDGPKGFYNGNQGSQRVRAVAASDVLRGLQGPSLGANLRKMGRPGGKPGESAHSRICSKNASSSIVEYVWYMAGMMRFCHSYEWSCNILHVGPLSQAAAPPKRHLQSRRLWKPIGPCLPGTPSTSDAHRPRHPPASGKRGSTMLDPSMVPCHVALLRWTQWSMAITQWNHWH